LYGWRAGGGGRLRFRRLFKLEENEMVIAFEIFYLEGKELLLFSTKGGNNHPLGQQGSNIVVFVDESSYFLISFCLSSSSVA